MYFLKALTMRACTAFLTRFAAIQAPRALISQASLETRGDTLPCRAATIERLRLPTANLFLRVTGFDILLSWSDVNV